jgi:NADPH:quinone reductase-like Zn-dependent oxidoreductase
MNAAVVHAFDAPPSYTTFPDPVVGPGEQIVTVTAAALHQIVRGLASGQHYGSTGELPFIPGVDAAGRLADGTRVYFGGARFPYGTFCEQTVIRGPVVIPLPDAIDDATAAAIANPAMSSWAALSARAKFVPGESVLILGATGSSGQLAVQIAKRRGARRIVAAGRNPEALAKLPSLGADAVISLDQPREALVAAFRAEFDAGLDIVLDYLWGLPAEAVIAAIAKKGLSHLSARIRYIQIGSTAGQTISLNAASLRSSGLELLGSGFGSASIQQLCEAVAAFFAIAAEQPFHFSLRRAPLRDVEALWNEREQATRLVFLP